MADPELRLLSGLLHAGENEQQEFYLRQYPETLFPTRSKEYIWLTRFRDRYGRYPSPRAFSDKYSEPCKKPKDPLPALMEEIQERAMGEAYTAIVRRAGDMMDRGVPMGQIVRQGQEDMAAMQTYSANYHVVHRQQSTAAEAYYRERYRLNDDPNSRTIRTPWPKLNAMVPLFSPTEVCCVYARPTMGKTWFVQWWANYLGRTNVKTMMCSAEMSLNAMELRDEAIQAGISFNGLLHGDLLPHELKKWHKFKRKRADTPYDLHFLDLGSSDDDFAVVEQEARHTKPQVIILDAVYDFQHPSIQKINSEPAKDGRRSYLVRRLARATKTFVICVIQTNRESEDKEGKSKASAKNVYGSDKWLQNSDYMIEISGQRGSAHRKVTQHKARNATTGDYVTRFSGDTPDFGEHTLDVAENDDSTIAEFVE